MKLNPLREGAATPRPWVDFDPDPTAVLVADFVGAKRWGRPAFKRGTDRYADVTQIPGWQYSGSTSNGQARYAEDRAGKLIPFANGVPRTTDRGLLVEEARTNGIANSSAQDATVGTIQASGGTGALPSGNWSIFPTTPAAGLTLAITGKGTEFGLPYTEWRLSGTNTSGSNTTQFINFHNLGQVVAAPSQSWTATVYYRAVSIVAPTTGMSLYVDPRTAGGGQVAGGGTVAIGISQASGFHRPSASSTFSSDASVARAGAYFAASVANGAAVDVTFRLYAPQLEQGAFPTSPIITTGSAATRAADSAYITGLGAILGQFRTNKVTIANANPTTTAGISTTGSLAVSIVDDVAELAAAGLQGLATSGKVFKLDNSAGAAQTFAGFPGISGNTNTHTASAYLRGGVGVFCIGSVGCNAVPASAGYVRRSFTGPGFAGGGQLQVGVNAGQVMYVILPMLEESATVNEVIVTQNGGSASVGNPFTLVAWADLPAADGISRTLLMASDGTTANRIDTRRNPSNQLAGIVVADNAGNGASVSGSNYSGAVRIKSAVRVRPSSIVLASDGAINAPGAATGPFPTLKQLNLGHFVNGGSHLNGYIQRVAVYGDVSDAQLQALAA